MSTLTETITKNNPITLKERLLIAKELKRVRALLRELDNNRIGE